MWWFCWVLVVVVVAVVVVIITIILEENIMNIIPLLFPNAPRAWIALSKIKFTKEKLFTIY